MKVKYSKIGGGLTRKFTATNDYTTFDFIGKKYSIDVLYCAKEVKVYLKRSGDEIKIVEDKYGNLFLYAYREDMRFNGEDDRVDEQWSLVKDEEDADDLYKSGDPLIGRPPCVYNCETGLTRIMEDISLNMFEKFCLWFKY